MKIRQVGSKLAVLTIVILVMAAINIKIDGDLALREEFDSKTLQEQVVAKWTRVSKLNSKFDLEKYLATSEADVESLLAARNVRIKPSQEKKIHWNGDLQTDLSIVYIHGFSAGPLELEPTLSEIGKSLRANVFVTRLKAHALVNESNVSDGEEFATVRARDWVEDTEEALAVGQKIGRRVVVIAMSTGAPIVLESLDRRQRLGGKTVDGSLLAPPLNLAALVLLSPNFDIPAFGSSLLAGRFGAFFASLFVGEYYEFKTENDFHRDRWTSRYRTQALHAMMMIVANAGDFNLDEVKMPVLTVYTSKDDVVSVTAIEARSKEYGGPKELIDWPLSHRHQLSSAAFESEHSQALVALILEGLKKLNVGAREFENKSGKGF